MVIKSGLQGKLLQEVKVLGGRMGIYEVIDFVQVELAYLCSNEPSWRQFYISLNEYAEVIAQAGARKLMPSHAALSRFHSRIEAEAVQGLKKLLFEDLLNNGIPTKGIGGLYSRTGKRYIIFDKDGTRKVVRQRGVPKNRKYPPAKRRARKRFNRGYQSNKRGEVVCVRTTLQQSHTQEWLGTFAAPGNGKGLQDVPLACELCAAYMSRHELEVSAGILRLDGLYGYASVISEVVKSGMKYIARCADYSLLNILDIPEKLKDEKGEKLEIPDSSKEVTVFDVGWIYWASPKEISKGIETRLIVMRHDYSPESKTHVGKRIGDYVYELIVTNLDSSEFLASDMISLYMGRGGFEQTLSHENNELNLNRWYSITPNGQEWCQTLGQWLWNKRLLLGYLSNNEELRCTIWSDAVTENGECASTSENNSSIEITNEQSIIYSFTTNDETEKNTVNSDINPRLDGNNIVQETENQIEEQIVSQEQGAEKTEQPIHSKTTEIESLVSSNDIVQTKISTQETTLLNQESSETSIAQEKEPIQLIQTTQSQEQTNQEKTPEDFTGDKFQLFDEKTLICPEGNKLSVRKKSRYKSGNPFIEFVASAKDCMNCKWLGICCRPQSKQPKTGRRVCLSLVDDKPQLPLPRTSYQRHKTIIIPEELPSKPSNNRASIITHNPTPIGTKPILWLDLAAKTLRNFLPTLLMLLRFDIAYQPGDIYIDQPLTRSQRARRRLTYSQRLAKNALPKNSKPVHVHVHGLPVEISKYLDSLRLHNAPS
jgi:hypothetical protein